MAITSGMVAKGSHMNWLGWGAYWSRQAPLRLICNAALVIKSSYPFSPLLFLFHHHFKLLVCKAKCRTPLVKTSWVYIAEIFRVQSKGIWSRFEKIEILVVPWFSIESTLFLLVLFTALELLAITSSDASSEHTDQWPLVSPRDAGEFLGHDIFILHDR